MSRRRREEDLQKLQRAEAEAAAEAARERLAGRTAKLTRLLERVEDLVGRDDNSLDALERLSLELGTWLDDSWSDVVEADIIDGDASLRDRLAAARSKLERECKFAEYRNRLQDLLALRSETGADPAGREINTKSCLLVLNAVQSISASSAGLLARMEALLGISKAALARELSELAHTRLAALWAIGTDEALDEAESLVLDAYLKRFGIEIKPPSGYHTRLLKRHGGTLRLGQFVGLPWATDDGPAVSVLRSEAAAVVALPDADRRRDLARVILAWCRAIKAADQSVAAADSLLGPWYRDIVEAARGGEAPTGDWSLPAGCAA
jgi:hypothetical protein